MGFKISSLKTDSIPVSYTVGKLEDAIIDAIRPKDNNLSDQSSKEQDVVPHRNSVTENTYYLRYLKDPFKKFSRLGVRVLCWSIISLIYPFSKIPGKGDSLILIAKS